jgi:hypothetical protein
MVKLTPSQAQTKARAHGSVYDARRRFVAMRGGRSQRGFARELDVTHELVRRFECGGPLSFDLLFALGTRGVRLDWLLFGEGEPTYTRPRIDDFQSVSRLDFEPWEIVRL